MGMYFSYLASLHQNWQDILVIDRTIERDGKRYHILGMTVTEEWTQLYIIEPYTALVQPRRKNGESSPRVVMKACGQDKRRYQNVSEIYLGESRLQVYGRGDRCLQGKADAHDVQLFFDMMSAGWTVPQWLRDEDWEDLQLVSLTIKDMPKLPNYTSDMPIVIKHGVDHKMRLVEKTITLTVGKSRSFRFTDHDSEDVWCYINDVTLLDVWQAMEEQLAAANDTPEGSAKMQRALTRLCPQGMCWTVIAYECSKDLDLHFYTKEYLRAYPKREQSWADHEDSGFFFHIPIQRDKTIGIHDLPLKIAIIQTPVAANTVKIPAELFCYYETIPAWEETV